jgi:hypothetical protein
MSERPKLDLDRIGKLLGVAGTSAHEGEAVNAIRAADRPLREAGMRWPDLTDGYHQAEIATQAAAVLVAELKEARERLAALDTGRGEWRRVPQTSNRHQTAAAWCLDQYEEGDLYLNSFEYDFLSTIADWRGPLTQRQRPVFQKIIRAVVAGSGRPPP